MSSISVLARKFSKDNGGGGGGGMAEVGELVQIVGHQRNKGNGRKKETMSYLALILSHPILPLLLHFNLFILILYS